MAVNTLAPVGLLFSRNLNSNAPTYQTTQYTIVKTNTTKIGKGDIVASASGTTGYVALTASDNPSLILGVFDAVLPYFDTNLQQTVFLQWWTGTASPSADVGCLVCDDPTVLFRAQLQNTAAGWTQSWRGQNVKWVTGTNGAPNSSGISTLALDGANISTTSANYSFRIYGPVGMTGGPQDPANGNPWLEVGINPASSERLTGTGQ